MNEKSILQEKVSPELLDEKDLFLVVLRDDYGNIQNQQSIKLKDPFDFDITRFIPNDRHTDLTRFFDIANDLIQNTQEREGIEPSQRVKLVEDYNEDMFWEHGDEVISWNS